MKTMLPADFASDHELIESSLAGNREAFGKLVERYQSLICSLAYSACGNVARSEDLAQETFVAAWKQLRELRDRARFKSWLCGIARNLVNNSLRRSLRRGEEHTESLEAASTILSPQPDPHQTAVTQEEQALVWQALAGIPESYREPLILFYREQQSVRCVAESLEISEDTAKQRLSRGRALLRDAVAGMVEGTLAATRPTGAFTIAVLAALPFTINKAAAATATTVAGSTVMTGKGTTTLKMLAAGGIGSGLLGALLGMGGGALGAYAGMRASLSQAGSDRERTFIKRVTFWAISLCVIGTLFILVTATWVGKTAQKNPRMLIAAILVSTFGMIAGSTILSIWCARRIKQIRAEDQAEGKWVSPPSPLSGNPNWRYTSRATLLGIPLIDIRMGTIVDGVYKRGIARGWIAIGDIAFGLLFAGGGLACGGIAFGGLSAGVVSIGGLALGAVALGGGSFGLLAWGGLAVGIYALGGGAFGWVAAKGGLAWAKIYAFGGAASALHANDALARDFFSESNFFIWGTRIAEHSQWLLVLTLIPMIISLQVIKKYKGTDSPNR